MPRLIVFNHVTLDGYFTDARGDMSWAHDRREDPEFQAFTEDNARSGGVLLFGRVTYDLMRSFWPTPAALQAYPVVAERMNRRPKVVFSRSLKDAAWSNTRVVGGDIAAETRRMKEEPGPGLALMGSGSIVSQFAQHGLIDEYQLVVNPVVLGSGRTMFEGVTRRLGLQLVRSRVFRNGKLFLSYEPAA